MKRVYEGLTWAFGCLAVALLIVGTLAVPTQSAWADDEDPYLGHSCSTYDSRCNPIIPGDTPAQCAGRQCHNQPWFSFWWCECRWENACYCL